MIRIGQGYDIHALVPDRKLIIGGVEIPHTHGLDGHSDADVLLHAITDALLGGAALRDIGFHFPDTDPAFAGADSRTLLREAMKRVEAAGFGILNIDSTVIAQSPKLAAYVPEMIANIAADLNLPEKDVNVKAKTNEHLDAVGRKEAIIAQAVVLLGELADEDDIEHGHEH
ncbi:MAG: 2-C-methyl-D-erythritol 2,4-cyclodiphosphate synthase [Fluviibacter sp.]